MDIAAASMAMSAYQLQNQIGIAVMKMSMDTVEDLAQNAIEVLVVDPALAPAAALTPSGHLDIHI